MTVSKPTHMVKREMCSAIWPTCPRSFFVEGLECLWGKGGWNHLSLKGYCTPNQKLACFVLYLKIINTFLKKLYIPFYSILSKELKTNIEI